MCIQNTATRLAASNKVIKVIGCFMRNCDATYANTTYARAEVASRPDMYARSVRLEWELSSSHISRLISSRVGLPHARFSMELMAAHSVHSEAICNFDLVLIQCVRRTRAMTECNPMTLINCVSIGRWTTCC